MKNAAKGKGLRVKVDKKKRYAVIIWDEKHCFEGGSMWCLVSGLVVTLLSVPNVRGEFIVVLICLSR